MTRNYEPLDAQTYYTEHVNIEITEKSLTVGEVRYALKNIISVSTRQRNFPLWPGLIFLLWSAGIFYNDSLPAIAGVEPNHPLFKYCILLLGALWLAIRTKIKPKFDVHITTGDDDKRVARFRNKLNAEEFLLKIKNAI